MDKGIGQSTAIEFAKEGADIVVNYMHDRSGAEELAPLKINVNAVAPGMFLTPFNEEAVQNEGLRENTEAATLRMQLGAEFKKAAA